MGSTRLNPTHVGWVGLNFFLPTMVGWVKKFPQPDPTRPMHTPIWHGCINPSWLQSLDLAKISPSLVENWLVPAKISPYLSAGMQCRETDW